LKEYKNLFLRVGLTGLTNLIVSLSTIILLPILTKNLSINDYGLYVQINVTIALLSNICLMGMPNSLIRFSAASNGKKEIQEVFYSTLFLVIFAVICVSIIYFLFLNSIAELIFDGDTVITMMLPIILLFASAYSITLNFFRASHHIKAYNLFSLIMIFIQILITYYFVSSGYGVFGAVLALLISNILLFSLTLLFVIKQIGIRIPEFKNVREYLSFGLPLIPNNFYSWLVRLSDRYIIGIFLGTAFVGYYSPSYTLASAITMFSTPLSLILFPTLSKLYDENKLDEVNKIIKYSLKYFLALAIPSAIGLTLLSQQILTILSTESIATNSYLVTPFVSVSAIFLGAYAITGQIIFFTKKTKILLIIWSFAGISNLVLNILLIPIIGILGAAISTLIAYMGLFFFSLYYCYKYFRFDTVKIAFILKCILASIPMAVFIFIINPQDILGIVTVIIVSTIIYTISILLLKGFEKAEFEFIKELLNQ
jgi:O-antigen/teichoic acid export membrane protein